MLQHFQLKVSSSSVHTYSVRVPVMSRNTKTLPLEEKIAFLIATKYLYDFDILLLLMCRTSLLELIKAYKNKIPDFMKS